MYKQEYVSSTLHLIRLQVRYNVKERQLYSSVYTPRNKYLYCKISNVLNQ